MSKPKIVGIITLIAFVMGIALVGSAVAGEKFKWRVVWYMGKPSSLNVPGEEGQIMNIREDKGILTVVEGSKKMDGMAGAHVISNSVNTKTGDGVGYGRVLFTDRDGDRIYGAWEGKGVKGKWSGLMTLSRGTGKFDGLKGKATFSVVSVPPDQMYTDWEGEMESPR